MHSRSSGPCILLTRQPAEGRSRDGGLRVGEMERDCMLSHGTSMFLKEIMLNKSDHYVIHTCKLCGLIAQVNKKTNLYFCKSCKNYQHFTEVQLPYAFKLLSQELESMALAPRLITQ